jgi:5-methylcytosine-specific restriction endonuclease McrA
MKSLCVNDEQKTHLQKLIDLIGGKDLNGTEAWSAFSAPEASKTFNRDKVFWRKISFSVAERKTYSVLRQAVQSYLFNKCSGCCVYCRRPVGHYGWAWHIEHVLPKSKHSSLTFTLSNLTVGCVHCNQWKGSRVDRILAGKTLPIINPSLPGFRYSDHLSYVQISTDSLSFAKYSHRSPEGAKTYTDLSFAELERSYAINGMHPPLAALHEKIERAIGIGLSVVEGQDLADLLFELKQSIYKVS